MQLIVKGKAIQWLHILLLTLLVIELVVGGGGRITSYGALSLRMVFFVIALSLSICSIIYYRKCERWVAYWSLAFFCLLCIGSVNAGINRSSIAFLIEDIKPLLFFFMLPYFAITIDDIRKVDYVISLIKAASLAMAIVYLSLLSLLLLGFFNYTVFYNTLDATGEIFFRGQFFFFYKGFLYLCVGFFFFWISEGIAAKFYSLIVFVAIVLTLTRGFLLMSILTLLFYYLFIQRNKLVSLVFFLFISIIVASALPYYITSLGNKSSSDEIRWITIDQVAERLNPFSLIIGHGFGQGVPIRPDHMEISYLEIFHKQGVVGLLFWVALFIYCSLTYFQIKRSSALYMKYSPLYLVIIFVFIQSGTNPFLNNPIGLSAVLICLVCLKRVNSLSKSL